MWPEIPRVVYALLITVIIGSGGMLFARPRGVRVFYGGRWRLVPPWHSPVVCVQVQTPKLLSSDLIAFVSSLTQSISPKNNPASKLLLLELSCLF